MRRCVGSVLKLLISGHCITISLLSSVSVHWANNLIFIFMVLKTLFRAHSQERDSGETAVDVEAARLVAQKLGENGIGGYM